jgi:methionyl-tRNA formyltransferase
VVDSRDLAAPAISAPDVLAPGEVAATRRAVWVGTATGALQLGAVQPHGKKTMDAADWARGMRIETGEKFADE